jgi:hypothetical protein
MRSFGRILFCTAIVLGALPGAAQEPIPKNPISAINDAFSFHQLVMVGDMHGNVQEHQLLIGLIQSPEFSQRVSDIVLEGANARYQPLVDRYLSGENVSAEQLEVVWRDGLAIGPVADEPEIELFEAVRKTNRTIPAGQPRLRIVCGEAALNWDNVQRRDDLQAFIPARDRNYTKIVKEQVLAKHHKALLYMGVLHFLRIEGKPSAIEGALQQAGATTFVILPGSNVVGSYADIDTKFVQWISPWILTLQETWLGKMWAKPLVMGGSESSAHISGTLAESGDAFLFLGPRDKLEQFLPKRSTLEGTAYGKETERRLRIIFGEGRKPDYLPKDNSGVAPQYAPPNDRHH